jgi:hypothetical protein
MAPTLCTTDADFVANVKLENFVSGYGIEQVFFHGHRITGLTLDNLNQKRSALVDFYKIHLS